MTPTTIGRAAALLMLGGFLLGRAAPTAHADAGYGVSADTLGNAYISGFTNDSLGGLNAGRDDAFIAKYDAVGNLQWIRQLGTGGDDYSRGVSADGLGNAYISGWTPGSLGGPNAGFNDAFITKYDAAGNLQWTRQLGTAAYDESDGVSADGLGNVYMSGYTQGSLDGPNAGGRDAFITKYDAAGNLQWTRQLGSDGEDSSLGVSADGLGNVYISGRTDGNLSAPNTGRHRDDAFVAKYDAAGALQWTRQLASIYDDVSHDISADGLGNVYISGSTVGSLDGPGNGGFYDTFVTKYDAEGNLQWTRQGGGRPFDNAGFGVSADGLGNAYIAGSRYAGIGNDNDAFVMRYDAAGNAPWRRQLVNPEKVDWGYGASADGLGNVYLTGILGGYAFISRYDAAGNLQWTSELRDSIPEPASWLMAALASAAMLRGGKRGDRRTEG